MGAANAAPVLWCFKGKYKVIIIRNQRDYFMQRFMV